MPDVLRMFSLAMRAKPSSFAYMLKLLSQGRISEMRGAMRSKLILSSMTGAEGTPTAQQTAPTPAAAPLTLADACIQDIGDQPSRFWGAQNVIRAQGTPKDAREFAEKLNFNAFDFLKPKEYHDFNGWERERFLEVSDLICQVPASAITLLRAVDYVIRAGIEGDFVECGVFKGASPILMARTLMEHGITDRNIYLYDTFEGMPKPTEWDVDYSGARSMDVWLKTKWDHVDGSSDVYCSIEDVKQNLTRVPYPQDRFIMTKGKVEDTIPKVAPQKIALLRLDTDYYESTKHELEHLFPRLQKGGVLVIDDYGHFKGARKAVDEYFADPVRKPVFLMRASESVRFAVKVF